MYNVSIDGIKEFISDNEFKILEIKEEDITKNYRNDVRAILSEKETDIEREQFLDQTLQATEKKIWGNYIGIYYDINDLKLEKRLKNFTNRLEKSFIIKDVPFGVKNMQLFEYDFEVWEEFFFKIAEGYQLTGYIHPPYKKVLKDFFELNQRAYIVRKAYLQKQVLIEFITEVNSGNSVVPEDYGAKWKYDEKEKLKLLQLYKKFRKKSLGVEESIEKVFEHLKNKFNLMHLNNLEAAEVIHSKTGITFYKKNEGFTSVSAAKIIRDYKRYE